ncbi:chorismate lyase [Marinospirillum celere]|uniref:Probable chorismate pyruvate-lyase n=1 Tax=Marinospirillum celere TaxID=1122252 RepID=A0A1I1HT60_9GAMM|nr:chorismate lyase [Marinospirillum celere]SFC26995.1 chorismate lyase [Marinospirillum celere]
MPVTEEQLLQLNHWPAPAWQPAAFLTGAPSGSWRSWLQETGSLTRRLQHQATGSFRVRVLSQGVAPIQESERQWLQVRQQRVWVRQVLLEVDEQPWVFARSLLPLDSRGSLLRRLTHLGDQALGHLLFASPQVRRGQLNFCAPGQLPLDSLWGRASCFYASSLKLLVAEHYLPAMAERLQLTTTGIFGD